MHVLRLDSARMRERLPGRQTAKAVVAAVLSYVAAATLTRSSSTLVAPLTALLVTQVTVFETLTTGLRRVIAVVVGVVVAVAVSHVVVLHWWSLAVVLAVAFTIGALLRLEDHSTEVAISAMLVFAVRGSAATASSRISETLIGAAVGFIVNFVIAPMQLRPAAASIAAVTDRIGRVMDEAAADLRAAGTHDQAKHALSAARRLRSDLDRADEAVVRAERSLRLNPRAARFRSTAPSWRAALAALEHVAVSVREITRVLAERTEADGAAVAEVDRAALADLLGDLANVVRAFGRVAVGETGGASGPDADLLAALDRARRTRDRVASVLAVDGGQQPGLWAMNGALLQAAARIIREVDLEAGPDARHVPRSAPHTGPTARSAAAAVRAARNASRSLAANRLPSRTLAMAARARRSLDGLG